MAILTDKMKEARAAAEGYRAAINRTYAKLEDALARKDITEASRMARALTLLVELLESALEDSQ